MKILSKVLVFVLAIGIFIMAFITIYNSVTGLQYNENSSDCFAATRKDNVPLREGPSNSDTIILHLSLGTSVSLTGNTFNNPDGQHESWHEVITMSGHTGWILEEHLDF